MNNGCRKAASISCAGGEPKRDVAHASKAFFTGWRNDDRRTTGIGTPILLAIMLVLSAGIVIPSSAVDVPAEIKAADAPHNITHFLHTGSSAKYFSPQISVLNYFDTNLPLSASGKNYTGYEHFAFQWYMFPDTASNLTVSGIDVILWISGEVSTGLPNFAGSLEIFEVTAQNITDLDANGTLICTENIPSNTPLFVSPPSASMVFPMTFIHTFQAHSTIRFVLTINPGMSGGGVGSQYTNVTIYWDSTHLYDSRLILHTDNPMTIDSCWTENHLGEQQDNFLGIGNTTMNICANISDPYGGYDIEWVNLTLFDTVGAPIAGMSDKPMDRVAGSDTSPVCTYQLEWNYSGLPTGVYDYEVWAVDNSGLTYYYYFSQFTFHPYDELVASAFTIGLIYNLTLHLNDSLGQDLDNAVVKYDSIVETANETGWADMIIFGNGTLEIYWHDVVVYSSFIDITSDLTLYIDCAVYSPEIIVVDVANNPLPSAAVFFKYPDGEEVPVRLSNAVGSVGAMDQTPVGNNSLSVWWRGSQVFDGELDVQSNLPISVVCEVFYLSVLVLDPWGDVLSFADVMYFTSEDHILLDSRLVNDTGVAEARLPNGTYDIEVYWHGNIVASELSIALDGNRTITVIGSVFQINITVLDDLGIVMVGAHVVASTSTEVILSELTGNGGMVHAILPSGNLSIRTYWFGVLVSHVDVVISSSTDIIIECSVIYLDVNPVDSRGITLLGAQVSIWSANGLLDTNVVDAINDAVRIPAGQIRIEVIWNSCLVANETVEVFDSGELTIQCTVSYLIIKTEDAGNSPLSGVVIVVKAQNGEVLGYAMTIGGSTEFRLADQPVAVEGRFATQYMMTSVDLTEKINVTISGDTNVTLSFDEYPLAFYLTNLFALSSLVMLLGLAFGAIVIFSMKSKRGKAKKNQTLGSGSAASESIHDAAGGNAGPAILATYGEQTGRSQLGGQAGEQLPHLAGSQNPEQRQAQVEDPNPHNRRGKRKRDGGSSAKRVLKP